MFGHVGHGLSVGRWSGGRGSSSIWMTDFAPWRCTVPRQSAPVSPPPRMITRLPSAEMKRSSGIVVARAALVLQRQELHREVRALQFAPRHLEVASPGRPAAQRDRVELLREVRRASTSTPTFTLGRNVTPSSSICSQPPVEEALLHLEVRDAVPQQPADPVVPLEDRDGVPRARQLLRAGQPRRPGADNRDGLAGELLRRLRLHPALLQRALDDAQLDLLDRHRVVVDAEHARRLARRRAQPSGELREVVRRVQPVDRHPPLVAVHEVVPVRDDVPERAALVAERDARSPCSAPPAPSASPPGSPRRPPASRGRAPSPGDASASPGRTP